MKKICILFGVVFFTGVFSVSNVSAADSKIGIPDNFQVCSSCKIELSKKFWKSFDFEIVYKKEDITAKRDQVRIIKEDIEKFFNKNEILDFDIDIDPNGKKFTIFSNDDSIKYFDKTEISTVFGAISLDFMGSTSSEIIIKSTDSYRDCRIKAYNDAIAKLKLYGVKIKYIDFGKERLELIKITKNSSEKKESEKYEISDTYDTGKVFEHKVCLTAYDGIYRTHNKNLED